MTDSEAIGEIMWKLPMTIRHHRAVKECTFDGDNTSSEVVITLNSNRTYVLKIMELENEEQ